MELEYLSFWESKPIAAGALIYDAFLASVKHDLTFHQDKMTKDVLFSADHIEKNILDVAALEGVVPGWFLWKPEELQLYAHQLNHLYTERGSKTSWHYNWEREETGAYAITSTHKPFENYIESFRPDIKERANVGLVSMGLLTGYVLLTLSRENF